MSMRESIISAVVAALTTPPGGITAPTGLTVHRFSMLPIEEDQLPAAVVYWISCEPAEKQFLTAQAMDRMLEYHLTVRVECRVAGEPVDTALDPICQYVRQAIFWDPSLGGLCLGCREDGIQVDALARREGMLGAAACDFVFSFLESAYTWPEYPALGGVIHRLDFEQITPNEPGSGTLIVEDPTP